MHARYCTYYKVLLASLTCITFCISILISAVALSPLAYLRLSRSATDCRPAEGGSTGWVSPGLDISTMRITINRFLRLDQICMIGREVYIPAIRRAQARPKTTISSKELAPSLFAPCTDAHAASPAANKPGTIVSGFSGEGLKTSPIIVRVIAVCLS